jgi:serine/threonine protein kinase
MSKPGMVEEKWVRRWFTQIHAGLTHIHSKGYSHLDLKCENILLDENLNAKIADFGFAQINTDEGISLDLGSEFHRAPEICKRDFPYDGEKADVFSFAIIFFAMVNKSFPTERVYNVIDAPKYKKFTQGKWSEFWP